MRFYKLPILIFLIYLLVLLQTSFFVHFSLFRIIPNLTIILVVLWNFFEKEKKLFSLGLFISIYSGLLLDIYFAGFFGIFTAILLALTIFIKKFLRNYVRVPFTEGV